MHVVELINPGQWTALKPAVLKDSSLAEIESCTPDMLYHLAYHFFYGCVQAFDADSLNLI